MVKVDQQTKSQLKSFNGFHQGDYSSKKCSWITFYLFLNIDYKILKSSKIREFFVFKLNIGKHCLMWQSLLSL